MQNKAEAVVTVILKSTLRTLGQEKKQRFSCNSHLGTWKLASMGHWLAVIKCVKYEDWQEVNVIHLRNKQKGGKQLRKNNLVPLRSHSLDLLSN